MSDPLRLLAALRQADSFFPSGSLAFSWGLETLRHDGLVMEAAEVAWFVRDQLRHRWATFERPALVAAHRAADDLAAVARIDARLEAMSLARESREGSRRAGRALLGVHEKLATPGAAAYHERVRAGRAQGHLAAVQGVVWCGAGLDEDASSAVSAYTLCVGLLGAAVRLGLIGHIESQRSLSRLQDDIVELLAAPPPALDGMGVGTPQAEVAAMRHETQGSRLFIT